MRCRPPLTWDDLQLAVTKGGFCRPPATVQPTQGPPAEALHLTSTTRTHAGEGLVQEDGSPSKTQDEEEEELDPVMLQKKVRFFGLI